MKSVAIIAGTCLSFVSFAFAATPIKVACVGDSTTYGSGIKDHKHDTYPAQMAKMLGSGYDVINFGVSGATLLNHGDKPYTKQKLDAKAHQFMPDILVIMLGTNDSKPQNWKDKDQYVPDYKSLIESFRKVDPGVKVYLCEPPPAFTGAYHISGPVIANQIDPMIELVAKAEHTQVIDVHSAMKGDKGLFPDGIHPNPAGAKIMAKTIAGAIKR